MSATTLKRMNVFERYLSLWVALCMVAGVVLGKFLPDAVRALQRLEFGTGSQINIPIAILIWLMIYPMMLKIDFGSIVRVGQRPKGLLITVVVNWLVKPFSMAFLGWLFFRHVFLPLIGPELASQYTAGVIILAAAPCTAMVFVWSYLSDGDPAYTLVQVTVNDLIMLVAFAPIVTFLVSGAAGLAVPFRVLLYSVVIFVVIPLALGSLSRYALIRAKGAAWFESEFVAKFHPLTVLALLATLVLIFAFQAENITARWFHVVLIAIPILLQVYFNSSLTYGLMKLFRVEYAIAAPGALIGASNFFELAVATSIALYGPGSGAALATVVGVLVEVPVMLSVCRMCVSTKHWFAAGERTSRAKPTLPTRSSAGS
ncbi:MAG TPA: ACR3 family arsenite efflux transporter [Thermoanaerobaculia bacterium]|nr:ACR3 family arsenite efflux transporter [Thermoanaerobaculia bacterium]